MTEPAGRVTQISDPDLWQQLYAQWVSERYPGWITKRAGAQVWKAVQLSSGSLAFDPQDNQSYYESTSFPS